MDKRNNKKQEVRIFITGDTHRSHDVAKLDRLETLLKDTDSDNYLIIAGDFGGVWHYGKPGQIDEGDKEFIDALYGDRPWTTLFLDGNQQR